MSKKKKHKKKFKAQLHQAMQEMQREQPTVVTPVEEHSSLRGEDEELKNERTYEPAENTPEKITTQKSEVRPPKVDDRKKTEKIPDEYVYVKKDVTKIVMIMSICIVVLVAIWILSLRTNYISNFANTLATFSHLSQGK